MVEYTPSLIADMEHRKLKMPLSDKRSHPCCGLQGRDGPWHQQAGKLRVQELDWGNEAHIAQAAGPFHFVLAADCVYHEEHVLKLRDTVVALTDLKSTGALRSSALDRSVLLGDLNAFSKYACH